MEVIDYVREEVSRQGHDTETLDGIERVNWMLDAWCFALRIHRERPTLVDAIHLGVLIEPRKNANGIRTCGVRIGSRICAHHEEIQRLLGVLFEQRDALTPLEFYKAFEEIHPFVDGNGRTGKVLLNWIGGTLIDPIFPPDDLWGYPIKNP